MNFELEVYIDTRPNLRDDSVERDSYLGRRVLECIFDHMKEFDDEYLTLSYPERWLNIIEQRVLFKRLGKYGTNLKKVTVLTGSPFIIQVTPNESARMFMVKNESKETDDDKLYGETNMQFLSSGLNILGVKR